jgi:hypothetical protein
LALDRILYHCVEGGGVEVHSFQNLLEYIVDDVTKHEGIVHIGVLTLVLGGQERTSRARESFYYLSCSYEDVGLDNNHSGFVWTIIILVIVQCQGEIIGGTENSNNSDQISLFCPDLVAPLAPHFEFKN